MIERLPSFSSSYTSRAVVHPAPIPPVFLEEELNALGVLGYDLLLQLPDDQVGPFSKPSSAPFPDMIVNIGVVRRNLRWDPPSVRAVKTKQSFSSHHRFTQFPCARGHVPPPTANDYYVIFTTRSSPLPSCRRQTPLEDPTGRRRTIRTRPMAS